MAQPAPISYEVTGVTPDTQFTPNAVPIPGKRVAYTTSIGYADAVFIPDTVFSDLDAVRQLIEAEIVKVAAAQAITGTVTGS